MSSRKLTYVEVELYARNEDKSKEKGIITEKLSYLLISAKIFLLYVLYFSPIFIIISRYINYPRTF